MDICSAGITFEKYDAKSKINLDNGLGFVEFLDLWFFAAYTGEHTRKHFKK